MSDLLPSQIALIGEQHIKKALVDDGFSNVTIQAAEDHYSYITADGVAINVLIRLNTVLSPAEYQEFSDQEKAQIISYAILQNRIAYSAYIVINADGNLNGEIQWYKLS